MNCISGLGARLLPFVRMPERHWTLLLGLIVIAACGVETSQSADRPAKREYEANYTLSVDPTNSSIAVSLEIRQPQHLLRELRFPSLSGQFDQFNADGALELGSNDLTWRVPAKGGTLKWRVKANKLRGRNAYDAWLGQEWGIFRAEDAIPRAKTRALKGSSSITTLTLKLPAGWSSISEYPGTRDPVLIDRPERRFDEPTGWILIGDIGVRRETIAGIRVAVAGPQGHAVRRLDMLAFLHWILPELAELLPALPTRLTIISAGDPMWRGGLSAPASLFIHADRPLISENGSSPLLHEVLHVAMPIRAKEDADWIVEGIAEYYGIELLRRGNAISAKRYRAALADQANWAKKAVHLCGKTSTGPTTALAVTTLHALNEEIIARTSGDKDLDDLLRSLIEQGPAVSFERLAEAATRIIGAPSDTLHSNKLPGCPKMASGNQSG
jgi:hypothetical protein